MNFVYLIRMKSDHSLCSIWTTQELADAAVDYYDRRWGAGKVYIKEYQLNVTVVQ